jgi:hypothetical protein
MIETTSRTMMHRRLRMTIFRILPCSIQSFFLLLLQYVLCPSVILDAYAYHPPLQLFPRVSTQEARIALSNLQKAFTEAERVIPGVTLELVNEIVDSVEHVEDER